MNRINWDGNQDHLKSWKEIAGTPTTYENTYTDTGNTLVLMSINSHIDYRGQGVVKKLIVQGKTLASDLRIDYLIGSFRPNQYGVFKLNNPGNNISFEQYCKLTREDGLPEDELLRKLTRNGMQIIKQDTNAMEAIFTIPDFNSFRQTYKPDQWKELTPGIWECAEVGS
jgi:hypothetical protein